MMKTENVFLHFVVTFVFVFSFITTCAAENVKKSVDDSRDDNGETNDDSKDESLDIPIETEPTNLTCRRGGNRAMHEIRPADINKFPFMAALMSQQNDYLCSGAIVSNGMILTTAQCTQSPLSYALLNTTTDKKGEDTISLHIIKTEKFPTFTGSESSKDVGIVYTEKHNNSVASKIVLSNFTNPLTLQDGLVGIGFGLNADVGQTKDLQYISMENRTPDPVTDNVKLYFDCVETKVVTCFKDTGGPVLLDTQLVGIVVRGQDECTREMSATYAVNKKMVDVLPLYSFKAWLDAKISKNEEQEVEALVQYPMSLLEQNVKNDEIRRLHRMTAYKSGTRLTVNPTHIITGCVCLLAL